MSPDELLDATLEYVETHPQDWRQDRWRCGSGMCFAGWAVTLAGGKWATEDPDDFWGSCLLATAQERHNVERDANGQRVIYVEDRARRLLGLTFDQAEELFYSYNKLEDIRRIVGDIKASRTEVTA